MYVRNASNGRTGNEIVFDVDYCKPPNPNPGHLGCYRSELALQRAIQSSLIDWKIGAGSSERWFGFSNRLINFSWDSIGSAALNGPSFQIHGAGGLPQFKDVHPVLNLQVDSSGCDHRNKSCPTWTLGVSAGGEPNPACAESYDACWKLGPALTDTSFDGWNDWVIQWRGSPNATVGYVGVWRDGNVVLPKTNVATAYNDSKSPYVKFGVYRGAWKGAATQPVHSWSSSIAYGALKVGDETSSFDEVNTRSHLSTVVV